MKQDRKLIPVAVLTILMVFYGLKVADISRASVYNLIKLSATPKYYKDFPNMTLMVRTAGSERLTKIFYCQYLRSVVLFWPPSYGDLVIILDKESEKDQKLGRLIERQFKENFPEYRMSVYYEPLPSNPAALFRGRNKPEAYSRQLWSNFFAADYSNETIIAYMDTDVIIHTPMTMESMITNGTKLKVFAYAGFHSWVHTWAKTTHLALGLPLIANFMVTFPQLFYRDTIINCKKHILNHTKTKDFEAAFAHFYPVKTILSPVCILYTYAWFFEKDRYDWHIKVPNFHPGQKIPKDEFAIFKEINGKLSEGRKLQHEDAVPAVIPISHGIKDFPPGAFNAGFCRSKAVEKIIVKGCNVNITHGNFICDMYEESKWMTEIKWCPENIHKICCQKAVDEHYQNYARMNAMGIHAVQKEKAELITKLAKEAGVTCESLGFP